MHATKLPKVVVATALAAAALGATPLAQAGVGAPQKRPHIIGVLKRPHIIAVKHPDIIAILTLGVRKAGGDN